MPTEKPRFTITMDEKLLNTIDEYRFNNKFKSQTQAVLSLIEKGYDALQKNEMIIEQATSIKSLHEFNAKEKRLVKDYRQLDEHGKKAVDITLKHELERCNQESKPYIEMTVYNESAAAGLGNYLSDDSYNFETLSFPINEVPNGADFGIKISGDSMEPKISDGDIVWVKEQLKIENGQIGIFIIDGMAYCKKLSVDYDKCQVELVSLNKKYDNIVVNAEMKTVGKVLL